MVSAVAVGRTATVEGAVAGLDADLVGVASLADWAGTRLEESAKRLLPAAQSVVVVGMAIYPEILAHLTPEKMVGEGALRDMYAPHLEYLDGRLTRAVYDVAKASHRQGLRALPLPSNGCPLDQRHLEAVFSFKHAAQAAGLGRIGKSSLLITPQFGPRVRLACALTESRLAPTGVQSDDLCADCTDCLALCPSRALDEPGAGDAYSINKFACSAFRGASGACSECMKVCPVGA
ncbi:MAG: epoxyqueuosine reductase [Chloroflexi bacterium]|nr:epoxyqueuosine reductase [Chloroflexota bacterium]